MEVQYCPATVMKNHSSSSKSGRPAEMHSVLTLVDKGWERRHFLLSPNPMLNASGFVFPGLPAMCTLVGEVKT